MKSAIIMLAVALIATLPGFGFQSIPRFFGHSSLSAFGCAIWAAIVLGGAGFFAMIVQD